VCSSDLTQRVDANAVFAVLPPGAAEKLQQRWRFYVWDETTGEVRWMCSWDTTEEDVRAFTGALRDALASEPALPSEARAR